MNLSIPKIFLRVAVAALLAACPAAMAQGTPATSNSDAAQPKSLEKRVDELESPLAIKYKGITITPLGFLDLTGVYRSTNSNAAIGTSFGSIPFSNTNAGQLSESRISAQNSRLGLRTDGVFGKTKATLYFEGDFLGVQPSNPYVTSNSQGFRMRIFFANVRTGAWEVMAGQTWSLLTPNRTGISPFTSDVFYSQVVDTNYIAGLTWTRAAQFRLVYHPSETVAVALAAENPDQYIGSAVLPSNLSSAYGPQFDAGSSTSAPSLHPDILAKVAYDTKDRFLHVEAVGLYRTFKAYDPLTGQDNTAPGVGASLNLAVNLSKQFRLLANTYYSDGGGRYIGTGLGPDLIARPDGSLSAIHSMSTVLGFEAAPSPTWNVYGYYSGLYIYKNTSVLNGVSSGYGFDGSTNHNRTIQEGSVGFIHAIWKNPSYGTFSVLGQYSYLARVPWSVAAGTPTNAHANIVYLDVRYALP